MDKRAKMMFFAPMAAVFVSVIYSNIMFFKWIFPSITEKVHAKENESSTECTNESIGNAGCVNASKASQTDLEYIQLYNRDIA